MDRGFFAYLMQAYNLQFMDFSVRHQLDEISGEIFGEISGEIWSNFGEILVKSDQILVKSDEILLKSGQISTNITKI